MRLRPADLFRLTPVAFRHWGRLLLGAALALGLLLVVWMTWLAPDVAPLLPVVLLGGIALWYLFQRPLLNLCMILLAFVVVADYEAGFQFREVLYGLYLYGYLAFWLITRLFFYRDTLLYTAEEKALLLFLALLPCTALLTLLFGGSLKGVLSEGFALSLLFLYFPVREACMRHRRGIQALLLSLLGIGLFIALRNMLNYQEILISATQAWEVATGRVVTNDNLLMVTSLEALVLLVFARRWWSLGIRVGLFLIIFGGLILTQSRGYWLAFLLGAGVMFLFVEKHYKKRMILLGVSSLVVLLGVGLMFFGDYMLLVLAGLQQRAASLSTATTEDLSLVNRFYESRTVWELIVQNPVLGYGMGVPYNFFDITRQTTDTDAFVHNGYLSLWFKFGLWGLFLVLFFWARTIWRGLQTIRKEKGVSWIRLCSFVATTALAAFALSTLTSNPFFLKDTTFAFGLLSGLAGGAFQRKRLEDHAPSPT